MTLPDNRNDPGQGVESESIKAAGLASMLPQPADIARSRDVVSRIKDAYAVSVIGKANRRHVFFGLPAAEKAVARARARGDYAELVLVQLVPVGDPL